MSIFRPTIRKIEIVDPAVASVASLPPPIPSSSAGIPTGAPPGISAPAVGVPTGIPASAPLKKEDLLQISDAKGTFNSYVDFEKFREKGIWVPTGHGDDYLKDDEEFGKDAVEFVLEKEKEFLNHPLIKFVFLVAGHCGRSANALLTNNSMNLLHGLGDVADMMNTESNHLKAKRNKEMDEALRRRKESRNSSSPSSSISRNKNRDYGRNRNPQLNGQKIATAATTLNVSFRNRGRIGGDLEYDRPPSSSSADGGGGGGSGGSEDSSDDDDYNRRMRSDYNKRSNSGKNLDDYLNIPGLKAVPPGMIHEIYPNTESFEDASGGEKRRLIHFMMKNGLYNRFTQIGIDKMYDSSPQARYKWSLQSIASGFTTLDTSIVSAISDAKADIHRALQIVMGNNPYVLKQFDPYNLIYFYMEPFALAVGLKIFMGTMFVFNQNSAMSRNSQLRYNNAIITIRNDFLQTNRIINQIHPDTSPIFQANGDSTDFVVSKRRQEIRGKINSVNMHNSANSDGMNPRSFRHLYTGGVNAFTATEYY